MGTVNQLQNRWQGCQHQTNIEGEKVETKNMKNGNMGCTGESSKQTQGFIVK